MALDYGIVSSKTDCVISAGLTKEEAERMARVYTEQFDFPYGYVELKSGFDFEMKNVKWITRSLFEDWFVELKSHPYLGYADHEDLVAIGCGNRWHWDYSEEDTDEEIICVLEKKECKRLAKKLCEVELKDFNYWIKNEYTWDDSEAIIDRAIAHNKVLKIWI